MMPLYPAATESLDLRGFELVISSDSGPIKGVRLDPGAVHICYCHSPMRYLYDGYEAYRSQMSGLIRAALHRDRRARPPLGPASRGAGYILHRQLALRRSPHPANLRPRS